MDANLDVTSGGMVEIMPPSIRSPGA